MFKKKIKKKQNKKLRLKQNLFNKRYNATGSIDGILHGIISTNKEHHSLYIKDRISAKDIICEISCTTKAIIEELIEKLYQKRVLEFGLISYIVSAPRKIIVPKIENITHIKDDNELPNINDIYKIFKQKSVVDRLYHVRNNVSG